MHMQSWDAYGSAFGRCTIGYGISASYFIIRNRYVHHAAAVMPTQYALNSMTAYDCFLFRRH
jgi:hypothetical protein